MHFFLKRSSKIKHSSFLKLSPCLLKKSVVNHANNLGIKTVFFSVAIKGKRSSVVLHHQNSFWFEVSTNLQSKDKQSWIRFDRHSDKTDFSNSLMSFRFPMKDSFFRNWNSRLGSNLGHLRKYWFFITADSTVFVDFWIECYHLSL